MNFEYIQKYYEISHVVKQVQIFVTASNKINVTIIPERMFKQKTYFSQLMRTKLCKWIIQIFKDYEY